jgi:hypothetical protein
MKKQLFNTPKYLLLAALAVFMLTACKQTIEDPEVVLEKAKKAITEVDSGLIQVSAEAEGQNGTDDLMFEGDMELSFNKKDEENSKYDLSLMLAGDLTAAENSLSGDLDLNFVAIQQDYYVKLNKLYSSDEGFKETEPFIDLYKEKWLRIAEDFIPENIRTIQDQDEEALQKKQQLRELFIETTLFDVVKEYGVEKLSGQKVYHYGLQPNMDGFKDYMAKAAVIDGRELTMQEIAEAVKVLTYIKNAELYIDVDDYYVLKSVFQFSGEALGDETASNLEVDITLEGSDYNKNLSIEAPEAAEDFNPLALIMGLGALPTSTDDGEAVDGVEEDVEEESEGLPEEEDLGEEVIEEPAEETEEEV